MAEAIDVVVVVVGDNPSEEGVAVVGVGSSMGLMVELLSGSRAGREAAWAWAWA